MNSFSDFDSIDEKIDYNKVNSIIENERKKSIQLLKKAIGKRENNINSIGIKKKCTGCRMCEQICPKGAIMFIENKEGFLEPLIDKEKCINCGLCLKRCPQQNDDVNQNFPIKCYAAKNKNKIELINGSSGSIFAIIADYVLGSNGEVYGAAFQKDLKVQTVMIDNKEKLNELMGSKYIQSDTNSTFKQVKLSLDKNVLVLYVGTPCQIAGLKSFLSKEYKNLIAIDLVCHGVPSNKLFQKYIQSIQKKYNSKIEQYYFRNKEKNGWGLNIKIKFENGKTKYSKANLDPYFKTFLEGKTYREVCYNCKYANLNRIGDITLADYWGIEKEHPDFDSNLGVSAVLINSQKGKDIFKNIKNNLFTKETNISKIIKENRNLTMPTRRPNIRSQIYTNIDNMDFKEYASKNLKFKKSLKDILKNMVPFKVKNIIKKIIIYGGKK